MDIEITAVGRLARANAWLTALAFAVLAVSFGFGFRGGAEHRTLDRVQFLSIWAYVLLTPLLSLASLGLRDRESPRPTMTYALLALWFCVVVAGSLVHF